MVWRWQEGSPQRESPQRQAIGPLLSPWSWVLGTVRIYMNIEHLTEKKKVSLCVHSNTTYSSQNVDSSLDKLQQDVEHLWPTIQGNKLVLK